MIKKNKYYNNRIKIYNRNYKNYHQLNKMIKLLNN